MLKSLLKELTFPKSLIVCILQEHMYDWKVGWHNLLLSTWNDILIDMDMPEKNCPELTEKTADSIDDSCLQELFVSTQINNLGLCVKAGLQ